MKSFKQGEKGMKRLRESQSAGPGSNPSVARKEATPTRGSESPELHLQESTVVGDPISLSEGSAIAAVDASKLPEGSRTQAQAKRSKSRQSQQTLQVGFDFDSLELSKMGFFAHMRDRTRAQSNIDENGAPIKSMEQWAVEAKKIQIQWTETEVKRKTAFQVLELIAFGKFLLKKEGNQSPTCRQSLKKGMERMCEFILDFESEFILDFENKNRRRRRSRKTTAREKFSGTVVDIAIDGNNAGGNWGNEITQVSETSRDIFGHRSGKRQSSHYHLMERNNVDFFVYAVIQTRQSSASPGTNRGGSKRVSDDRHWRAVWSTRKSKTIWSKQDRTNSGSGGVANVLHGTGATTK